jgi:hypothetical protein
MTREETYGCSITKYEEKGAFYLYMMRTFELLKSYFFILDSSSIEGKEKHKNSDLSTFDIVNQYVLFLLVSSTLEIITK